MFGQTGNEIDPTKIEGRPYIYERKDRKKGKYCVRFKLKEGGLATRAFATEFERGEFMREHRLGAIDGSFNAADWQRWLNIKLTCERHGMSPERLLAYAIEAEAKTKFSTKSLKEVYDEFYDAKSDKSKDYVSHIKSALGENLVPCLGGDRQIDTITSAELQNWLNDADIGAVTRKNRRGYLRTLFAWAKQKGYVLTSPADGLQAPEPKSKTPGILTPEHMQQLMEANKDHPETCAILALGAFAGLRSTSIERIEPHEIRIKERQLFFPAEKFKTDRAHLIEHAPENLWPWLERADLKKAFPVPHRRFLHIRDKANKRAEIVPPHNALRHSFATYKCALDGSAEKASYILGHTNPAEIWQSYKGIATKSQAEKFFAILP